MCFRVDMSGSYLVAEASSRLTGIIGHARFEWYGIPTRGARCLTFEGLFAASGSDTEPDDFIHVDYKPSDANLWQPLVRFVSSSADYFVLDADFDGKADKNGLQLRPTAQVISALTRPVNGAPVDLRLTFGIDANREALAFDSFRLSPVECPELPLLNEGFDDPNSVLAEPAFYSPGDSFFGIQSDDSLFGGVTGSYLAQQGPASQPDRRRAIVVTYTTWDKTFDIAFVDKVAVAVNLSSNSAATTADSVELQVDVDARNRWKTLARFVGDGTVFRQDADLDGVADVAGAIIAVDNSSPYQHTLSMDVGGSTLKLRLAFTFVSTSVDVAVDGVSVSAVFVAPPPTTPMAATTVGSNVKAALPSASNDNVGVRFFQFIPH